MAGQEVLEGFGTVLVLGGGNALGAYHLGVAEALLPIAEPDWIIGCSIGAVTGAILLGNPPESRLDRLREFWRQVALRDEPWVSLMPGWARARWSNGLGLNALLVGRRGVTVPRFPGLLSILPGMPSDVSLQDHRPLAAKLDQLVDWGRLNDSPIRFTLIATDLERGEEVRWDSRRERITVQHVLASAALPPLLPPVEVEGRWFWDGGLGNNLPVDVAFSEAPKNPLLVIASDLYAPEGRRPDSLDGAILRAQDVAFGLQAKMHIGALKEERGLWHRVDSGTPPAILAHLILRPPPHQRVLKALDFSATALDERVGQGRADMTAMLQCLSQAPRNEPLAVLTLPPA